MTIAEKLSKKGFDIIEVMDSNGKNVGYYAKEKGRNYKSSTFSTKTELLWEIMSWFKPGHGIDIEL